ncbi:Spt20 family-domain-containing protein [Hypoxylon sp. FL0543]|nr:Spt20 family-domain-containing protein [Hypoxylon sp. FL0543]
MAPVVAALPPPPTPKLKRPPPPGIQTNGVSSSQSSPSPNIPAKRPPPAVAKQQQQQASNSAATNGTNGNAHRPGLARSRRDTANHGQGRAQRNNASLRSATFAPEIPLHTSFEPRPDVVTDSYILKKYAGQPPSLIVHLHPTHFRFDQQDSVFPYKSPMKLFLDHVRSRTVPHEILYDLNDAGVAFYEGCLIVQIHDHKTPAQSKDVARPASKSSSEKPSSIHNYNPYITPSPYVPYPKDSTENGLSGNDEKPAENDSGDKENMPAPPAPGDGQKSKVPPKAKIFTVVLHPTPQSLHADLIIKASTPCGFGDGKAGNDSSVVPPTPMSAVPPTPSATSMPPPAKRQKREKMELDASNIYVAEAQILLATTGPLHLEPCKTREDAVALLQKMADPKHSEQPPKPKIRKRTVAERAADEALAAEQEKYMLTYDERRSANSGGVQAAADGADSNGQSGATAFEPRFERFKVLADIKREHAAKKEQEKIRQAENERKLQLQKQEQAALLQRQQAEQQQQHQQQQEKLRREEAQRQAQVRQQQQQEAQRRAMAQQQAQAQAHQAQAAQAQAQAAQSPQNTQMNQMPQSSHGHPTQNGLQAGVISAQAPHRFPQQVSQPPVSSPVVRQNTPQNMSSPMVGNAPMQQTNSGMGGSPPRSSSVVQAHGPMSAPMAVSMSARGSQQSHPSNTPRMPSATPQMPHGTPINRPMPTPRMTQASPPPGMMAQNSHMGQMMMGNQNMGQGMPNPMMVAQIQQQQRQRIAQQQQLHAMQNANMMNGQNPQMHNQMLQQQILRQQMMNMNMQGPNMMNAAQQAQLAQRYQQQINSMQQQQMQGQMPNQQMGNQSFIPGSNGMSPAHMAAMQQQMQQLQQQGQHPGGQPSAIALQVRTRQQQFYRQNIQAFAERFGGLQSIPPEMHDQFKQSCFKKAQESVQRELIQRRQMAQNMAQAQNGMQNGMGNGMPNGMQGAMQNGMNMNMMQQGM